MDRLDRSFFHKEKKSGFGDEIANDIRRLREMCEKNAKPLLE